MKQLNTMRRIQALFPFVVAALVPFWGCDILDEEIPETAKIEVKGGGGESFQLVTTNDFDLTADEDGENRDIYIYSADTTAVTAPYSKSYSLGSGVRFYLKAFSTEGLSQPVTIKLLIDGDQRYKATSDLANPELEFSYTFR